MSLNDSTSELQSKTWQGAARTPSGQPFVEQLVGLNSHAAGLRLRANQRIALNLAEDTTVYAIRTGVLLVRACIPNSATPYLRLHFAGDIVSAAAIPQLPERSIIAATSAEVWRLKSRGLAEMITEHPELAQAYEQQRNLQDARVAVHTAALGALDGHQRLAAFLIELAREIGVNTGTSVMLDLPLSRVEIAQYLSLNADTLSRIMSRLKQEGLVAQTSRHCIILRDWPALLDHCPIAGAILALGRGSGRPAELLAGRG